MPTNLTAATATVIASLPSTITDTTPSSAGLWYLYTGTASPNAIGIFCYSANTNLYLNLYSPDAATLVKSLGSAGSLPLQWIVEPTVPYFVNVRGAAAAFTLSVIAGPTSAAPAGSLFVFDDTGGYPGVILSATTGAVLQFRSPFAASDYGAVLAEGSILAYNEDDRTLTLYDPGFTPLATIGWAQAFGPTKVVATPTRFYVGNPGGVGPTPARVTTVSATGTLGPRTWILPAAGLTALAPSPDETILYLVGQAGIGTTIQRWDLVENVARSALVAVGAAIGKDLVVLADGTLLAVTGSFPAIAVHHYSAAGAVLHTYPFALAKGNDTRLSRALDDPGSFWIWEKHTVTGVTRSVFSNIRISDGATLSTTGNVSIFSAGVLEDPSPPSPTPSARFGHSSSCPLLVLPPAVSAPDALTGRIALTAPAAGSPTGAGAGGATGRPSVIGVINPSGRPRPCGS